MARNSVSGKGIYSVICDECGFKFKNTDLTRRYDGAMVCKSCWEPRHPQEFIRLRTDTRVLPYIRSDVAGASVAPTVNCDTLTFDLMSIQTLNAMLSTGDVTVYKLRVYGGGDIEVPVGSTLTVVCTLEVTS